MEADELFRKLRPALGKKIDDLWLEYQLKPENRKEIEGLLNVMAMQHLGQTLDNSKPLLLPPGETTARGRYEMGAVVYGNKTLHGFGLRETEMIQHVAVFGRTGSGKTNVAYLLLDQLVKQKKPFIVFDWKRNYRDLLGTLGFESLRVFTIGRPIVPFSFNPLSPPPGTERTSWAKKVVEIMCHVYFLGDGVAYLLQKAVDAVANEQATLADLKAWLESYKARGRQAQWMDSALRLVGTLCHAGTGEAFAARDSDALARLLDQQVVFELDALNDNDKTFFIETVLLWIHHYRLQEPKRETFKHALVIEEAHHVLLRRTEGRESIPDLILREIRELGESVVLIDQHPSLVSIPALGNTHTTIALNLKHGRDLAALREALQLSESEESWLASLEVGAAIVKLQSRYDKPFLVRFPLVSVSKGAVTDEMLAQRIGHRPAEPMRVPASNSQTITVPTVSNESKEISGIEKAMLCDIIAFSWHPVRRRYPRLGLSKRQGQKVIDDLMGRGILRSDIIKSALPPVRFLQLTGVGENMCESNQIPVVRFKRGGPDHEYWRARIWDELRARGWNVEPEAWIVEDHPCDLLAEKNGRRIAVEIETGLSNAEENLSACLRSDVDKIFLLSIDPVLSVRVASRFAAEINRERLTIATHINFSKVLDRFIGNTM